MVLAVLFLILSTIVGLGWTASLDGSIYERMLLPQGTTGSDLAQAVNQISGVALAVLAGAAGLVLSALRRNRAWLVLLAPLATIPIEVLAKNIIPRTMGHAMPDIELGSYLTIAAPYTFPSGNMARVTALVLGLYLHPARTGIADIRTRMGILAFIIAACLLALAAWSHLAIGDHWPSDVLGGLLLGGAASCAFGWILKRAPE